jgi:hypothetical protein
MAQITSSAPAHTATVTAQPEPVSDPVKLGNTNTAATEEATANRAANVPSWVSLSCGVIRSTRAGWTRSP